MTGYMINFGVYTMAMVGIIAAALLVYKKSTIMNSGSKSNLKIDDRIALNARKSLYVVNAGGERFLIAGDLDNTSLIAKLGQNDTLEPKTVTNPIRFEKELPDLTEITEKKPFVSRETKTVKLPEFKTEFSEAQKSLDKAFEKGSTVQFDKYLDIKRIRKKPVMKELARKLAEI